MRDQNVFTTTRTHSIIQKHQRSKYSRLLEHINAIKILLIKTIHYKI